MPDHATSASPAVQAQLDRLWSLSPGADVLGLGRITELLARLGNPHHRMPPVLHVAGTNGKGSTCAYLRAAIEAAGYITHVYTSPHLVRFNERIRLAGTLIDDDPLAELLREVLDQAADVQASFFEITTAAAFLAFSRTRADACIVEVGLGGRLDATNVVTPVVTGIAQLGIDHQAFLGDTLVEIAGEKAGIAKPGVPLVTMAYPRPIAERIARIAQVAGAPIAGAGEAWRFACDDRRLRYEDTDGAVETPLPVMAGPHQPANFALAIAMLRCQTALTIPHDAYATAAVTTRWPARLQRLRPGPLTGLLPTDSEVWLDGGHNPAAGVAIAAALSEIAVTSGGRPRPINVILGMLANKDSAGLLGPMAARIAGLTAVPVSSHDHHDPAALVKIARDLGIGATGTAPNVADALRRIADRPVAGDLPPIVLILGSLHLAGEVLGANDEPPT